jgi:hypothetical protein
MAGRGSGDRFPDNAEADGSIPSSPTKVLFTDHFSVVERSFEFSRMTFMVGHHIRTMSRRVQLGADFSRPWMVS